MNLSKHHEIKKRPIKIDTKTPHVSGWCVIGNLTTGITASTLADPNYLITKDQSVNITLCFPEYINISPFVRANKCPTESAFIDFSIYRKSLAH